MHLLEFGSTQSGSPKKYPVFWILSVIGLVITVALSSTLAANISLNGGGNVEFGQGVAQTTACDNEITLTPYSSFINIENGGEFALSSLRVSGIDSSSDHCANKSFRIRAWGDSENTPLPLIDSITYVDVADTGSAFILLTQVAGLSISSTDNTTFTLIFDAQNLPVSASSVYRFTIESKDYVPVVYEVGDTGPGGGRIVYVAETPFACGALLASTCNYLEAAPEGWAGTSDDRFLPFAIGENNDIEVPTSTRGFDASNQDIGAGYENSLAIVEQNGSCATVSECTYAAGAARAFNGGGFNDWYLPSIQELMKVMTYASDCTPFNPCPTAPLIGIEFVSTSASNYGYYWSSTQYFNDTYPQMASFNSIYYGGGGGYKIYDQFVRPVRAF